MLVELTGHFLDAQSINIVRMPSQVELSVR